MAWGFSAWTPRFTKNGLRADDGLVKEGFAKLGAHLQELVDALNAGTFGGSGVDVVDNLDGTQTLSSSSASVSDNSDGTQTITL